MTSVREDLSLAFKIGEGRNRELFEKDGVLYSDFKASRRGVIPVLQIFAGIRTSKGFSYLEVRLKDRVIERTEHYRLFGEKVENPNNTSIKGLPVHEYPSKGYLESIS